MALTAHFYDFARKRTCSALLDLKDGCQVDLTDPKIVWTTQFPASRAFYFFDIDMKELLTQVSDFLRNWNLGLHSPKTHHILIDDGYIEKKEASWKKTRRQLLSGNNLSNEDLE